MKKFLCYDTNDVANGKIDVDSRGMLKSTGSSAQADWNVTDSADPAFIKNKPFGVVPGVEVFSGTPSDVGTDEDGNQVFTYVSSSICEMDSSPLTSIGIGQKTYENIPTTTTWNGSTRWTVTFDTTGLPFTMVLNSGYSGGTTVVVTSLDGSYIGYISIKNMKLNREVKIDKKYLPDPVQSNWSVTDSSNPAFILNKPEIPNGVTWFSASGTKGNMVIKRGKDWNNGTTVYGENLIDAFENGICRCKVTITMCGTAYDSIGTITGYREFVACDSHKVGVAITCHASESGGENSMPMTVEASARKANP